MNAGCLGVFELQAAVVQGRPTYKKRWKEQFLFYSTGGTWMVGSDTSKSNGWWEAKSGAMTPGAITEAWQIHDGSAWVDVRAAKIVKRAAFEAAALDDVMQIIGNVNAWVMKIVKRGSAWVDVRAAAKIVKRAAFEAAALDDIMQIIGNVTAWVMVSAALFYKPKSTWGRTIVSVTAWVLAIVTLMTAMGAACTGVSYATRMALNTRDG